MNDSLLDKLDRKVDTLLERTKNVESDHAEIIKLRERMHKVEGAQGVFGRFLDEFQRLNEAVSRMDDRLETVEADQVTTKAVKEALNQHQERVTELSERRERRIFAILGLLASLGVVNFLTNIVQNSP